MAELLSDDQITDALRDLPGWEARAGTLHRAVTAPDFLTGVALVSEVAQAAEQQDHHPDIDIRWTTVTFTLSTHSEGGITTKDVSLARDINRLAESRAGR
ncbi:4a-hydroxytetrahydrobiopterin dehydratase [Actinopolymorpha sp. B9G3]|uniref:4a-hydroxytetrahydrobiopterin dehydratase n=1 Tax=Actinopolymorpha sp. B9G3 TaxID=3158970 RepID=UPI0032D984C8